MKTQLPRQPEATSRTDHPPARKIDLHRSRLVAGRVARRCLDAAPAGNRVSRHDVLVTHNWGHSMKTLRLLGHEETGAPHSVVISDAKHPVMLGASGFLDHEPPFHPV